MRLRFTGLWRHADFVRLWAGQTVSIFGSLVGGLAMDFTAVLWLHASAIEISVLATCRLAPGFLVGLFAGAWVDRMHRRPILIAADFGRAIALVSVPIAAAAGRLTVEQLYVVALATSTLGVFFQVAYEAYLPTLVERDELVEGNSKMAASASVSEFGAFSASGWLVQLVSGPGAVLIDAWSFVVSAFSIWRIRKPEPPPTSRHEGQHLLREVADGLREVWGNAILRTLALTSIVWNAGTRMIGVTYLLYLNRELGFGAGVLGMIFAIGGLTSLAGSAVAGKWSWFGGLGPTLALASVIRATGTLFMPLAASVSLLGVAFLVLSQVVTDPAWTVYDINAISLRQSVAPERALGRVTATMHFIDFGAFLLGTFAGGVLGQVFGFRETLFIATGLMFGSTVWLLVSPIARLKTMPGPRPDLAVAEGGGAV